MSDQDSNLITATPAIEANEGPSREWLAAHRTTAEEQENARWLEGRGQDVVANRVLRDALGLEYEAYRNQLHTLSSDERLDLIDKSPEEIAAHLDERAEAERGQKKRAEASEQQARDQREANFAAGETPQLREVRKAMKTAYQEATGLDERIAELQRLNDLRSDPAAKGWDDLPAERWAAAREGKLESLDGEIANLIQVKQAKLQEAALHQSAYHEGTRAIQPPPGYAAPDNRPIGQIVGNDGQPVQLTRGDIAQIVQLERDQQNFVQRSAEASKRHPDWAEAAHSAARAGVDVTSEQAQFIMTLPNGPDVAYHLAKNHAETRALARMSNHEAARELIRISHQYAAQSAPTRSRETTSAPRPPSPVSGSSRGAYDVNDESGSATEWMHRRNADLNRRGKL